jgi:hypothetical protein
VSANARPDARRPVDRELVWLQAANVLLEAAVIYLVLGALTSGRQSAPALPLLVALSLPVGLGMRWLLEASQASEPPRGIAHTLSALAWSIALARFCGQPEYWQSASPREMLLLGAIFGGRDAGAQPVAFWGGLLVWWRGQMLLGWEPTFDEALGRLRIGSLVVGLASIGISDASTDLLGGLAGQLAGLLVFLAGALLATSLARRREIGGGIPLGTAETTPTRAPTRVSPLVPAIAVCLLLVLALSAWGAEALTPTLLAPVVYLFQAGFWLLGSGLLVVAGWLASIWPRWTIEPRPSEPIQPLEPIWTPPIDLAAVMSVLVPLFVLLSIACLVAVAVLLLYAIRQSIADRVDVHINAVAGGGDEPEPQPEQPAGPLVLVALLTRWMRALRGGRRGRAGHQAAIHPAGSTSTPRRVSVRDTYRAFLTWAAGRGISRRRAETPRELRRRLGNAIAHGDAQVALITELYELVRYGDEVDHPERARLAAAALARLSTTPGVSAQTQPRPVEEGPAG